MQKNLEEYKIELITQRKKIKARLLRSIAPITTYEIVKKLPLKTRIIKFQDQIIIPIPIEIGKEKSIKNVTKGTITYSPINRSMIIHLKTKELKTKETKIGEITELNKLDNIQSGTGITVKEQE